MKYYVLILISLAVVNLSAQSLPYQQIPDYPEDYTSGNVISRLIDGLGYRYYWASEGLREEDLNYKISEDSRSAGETIEHIYGLSRIIVNAAKNEPNVAEDRSGMNFDDFRKGTLENLKQASELFLGRTSEEVSELKVIFKREDSQSEFPYWHMLNGPIADALYHTGQIVTYRRASGNPINPNVSVFMGKNRE